MPPRPERRSSRARKKASILTDDSFQSMAGGSISHQAFLHDQNEIPSKLSLIYGKMRPPGAPSDVCAVCHKKADDSEVVLLCDGANCHREYHLSCANLTRMPAEDEPFYCFDCHPTGARASALQKYLDQHMDERHDDVTESSVDESSSSSSAWTQSCVWKKFIAKDLVRMKKHSSPKSIPRKGSSVLDLDDIRIPRSELHNPKPWLSTTTTEGRSTPDRRPFLIGCPIRLYVPQINDYVAGRIVDHRERNGVQHHYVRFPAGTSEMKQGVTAWIVLEEHAALVNTGVVLVKPDNHTQATSSSFPAKPLVSSPGSGDKRSVTQAGLLTPVISKSPTKKGPGDDVVVSTAWVRTSRELLSLKNIQTLSIPFYGKDESPWNCSSPRPESAPLVLIRNFGAGDRFRFVPAPRLEDADFDMPHASIDQVTFSLAKSESMEKKRVRKWYALQSKKRRTHGGIFKRDVDELDSVDARPRVKPVSLSVGKDVLPCLSVRPGLDRLYLAQRLGKLGYTGDAATIQCEGVQPFYEATSRGKRIG